LRVHKSMHSWAQLIAGHATPHTGTGASNLHSGVQAVPSAVESAAQLHIYASEHGLDALGRFCAAFLAVHITTARAAPSYKALGTKELDEVLEAVAGERELLVQRLESLSCGFADLGADFAPLSGRGR
jgi:hypothetical protein